MSTFEVRVYRCAVETHPGADALDLVKIGGFTSISRRDSIKTGDLVAYIPEDSIVPAALLEEMGLTGRLAGSNKDRVKAVRLRGVFSQGLVYPAKPEWTEGQVVTDLLGVTKYEPVIPAGFQGELQNVGGRRTLKYDVESLAKFPGVIQPGEMVVMTEKCHGTFAMFGVMGEDNLIPGIYTDANGYEGPRLVIASKGVAARGLAFKIPDNANHANYNNIYCRTAASLGVVEYVEGVFGLEKSVFLLGEIFGPGVQDLNYGQKQATFRIFDIYVGNPGEGRFLGDSELDQKCLELDIPRVPVLYRGPFSDEALTTWTNGKETLSGKSVHVREGVVVRPVVERRWSGDAILGSLPCDGRVQLKSVSADYKLRKGDTSEFT